MADLDSWDADNFELDEPIKKAVVLDRWEGEDEEEDVKDNWDDDDDGGDDEGEKKVEEKKTEVKVSEKKKIAEKIKEKESRQRKKKEELKKQLDQQEEEEEEAELTPEQQLEEKLRVKKLQEQADLELAKEAFGVSNNVAGIDSITPSSREDFTEFGRLLKEKITQYEKSVHYSAFLDSLFRDLCISLELEDLKKISTSLTVLLSEKQKQEKQNKAKKKKKVTLAGGGLKATLKDDLDDYGEFDGGYAQDFEDFM